ncbi:hypothetical protein K440DRAFT_611128 [Wilcoxina mikolae CBS 423.85]|nr:hypothetical protein K440DRAFT_611128 [Wilcoxina mikolae CBS 423.85]
MQRDTTTQHPKERAMEKVNRNWHGSPELIEILSESDGTTKWVQLSALAHITPNNAELAKKCLNCAYVGRLTGPGHSQVNKWYTVGDLRQAKNLVENPRQKLERPVDCERMGLKWYRGLIMPGCYYPGKEDHPHSSPVPPEHDGLLLPGAVDAENNQSPIVTVDDTTDSFTGSKSASQQATITANNGISTTSEQCNDLPTLKPTSILPGCKDQETQIDGSPNSMEQDAEYVGIIEACEISRQLAEYMREEAMPVFQQAVHEDPVLFLEAWRQIGSALKTMREALVKTEKSTYPRPNRFEGSQGKKRKAGEQTIAAIRTSLDALAKDQEISSPVQKRLEQNQAKKIKMGEDWKNEVIGAEG